METSIALMHGHLHLQQPPTLNQSDSSLSLGSSSSSSKSHRRPVVIPRKVSDALEAKGFEVDNIGIVRWATDSATTIHPRKWPLLRKIYDSAIICFLEFFVTMISNTGSSMAPEVAHDLDISRESAVFYLTTIYLIGQALGGLVFPPMAESFGGRTIYLTSTFGFAVFSLGITACPTLPVVILCRFITGLLSAMPAVVAAGSIENMWDMTSRTFVIHIWIATAVVGLSLGPPIATFVSTSHLRWPFVFTLAGGVMGLVTLLCLGMQESRPAQILREQVKLVSKETSYDSLSLDESERMPSFSTFVRTSLMLPLRLFFTEPIVFATSLMAATVYGIIYLFAESLAIVYVEEYGFKPREASLVFLAISVGVALTFLPRIYDMRVNLGRRRGNVLLEPEDKLATFYFAAAPALAAGLWWFAWTVPPLINGVSPWASIASLVLVGYSVEEFDNLLSGYLTDTYATYAASANAPMGFLRATLSGVFPLFGQQMFRSLGPNNALFVLASVATAYCVVAALFGFYGKLIRQRSPFAEKTWAAANVSIEEPPVEISFPISQACMVTKEGFF